MQGKLLHRTQHVVPTDLSDQHTVIDYRQTTSTAAQEAFGGLDDIGLRGDGFHLARHVGTDVATDFLVIGPGQDATQAVTLREQANQVTLRIDHRRTGDIVFEQTIDRREQVHIRAEGHQMAGHVIPDLDRLEHVRSPCWR